MLKRLMGTTIDGDPGTLKTVIQEVDKSPDTVQQPQHEKPLKQDSLLYPASFYIILTPVTLLERALDQWWI